MQRLGTPTCMQQSTKRAHSPINAQHTQHLHGTQGRKGSQDQQPGAKGQPEPAPTEHARFRVPLEFCRKLLVTRMSPECHRNVTRMSPEFACAEHMLSACKFW
jgi:hypothetical protein